MTTTAPTYVLADDVHRRYGRGAGSFMAVRGVSFEVYQNELFALLGTNGAGKTSTVELLEGLASPHSGRVRVFGDLDPVADRARIRPRTGVMLQEGGFIGQLTVQECVQMWAGLTAGCRPVEEALELTGLQDRAQVMVQNLSGGEKRRLDLATATLTQPDLLFLDEPTAGMDAEGRHSTRKLIRRLQEQGSTIVLTTHDLEEAESLADRVAIMHRGQVAACGTVSQIVADHPSTLSFRLDGGAAVHDLPVASVSAPRDGRVVVETDHLQDDARRLLVWADDHGVTLHGFAARPASLEEAFIDIASRPRADDERTDP